MAKHSSIIVPFAALLLCVTAECRAADESSPNYGSSELLPGEQVTTPTGQKIKVWSTEGPVKVSPPPQPFDDPSKAVVDGVGVVLDDGDRRAHRDERPPLPRRPGGTHGAESFDFRSGR